MRLTIHRKGLLVLCFILAVFTSCRVTLVPSYNAELEQQIAEAAKSNDKLYMEMLDDPSAKRGYENYRDKYIEISSEIHAIQLKNEARQKSGNFLAIIKNLDTAFTEAREYHKKNNTLRDGEIKAYQSTISAFWKPLFIGEAALKNRQSK